jgi:ferric-dicitrate binding protein FerR (iron transport regulator)
MAVDKFNKEILFKYFQGVTTSQENKLLLEWIRKSESNKNIFYTYKSIWHGLASKGSEQEKGNWDDFIKRSKVRTINISSKSKFWINLGKYAAIFIVGFLSLWMFQNYSNFVNPDIETSENSKIIVPKGSKTHLILPDGTQVWLNAGSTLTYPERFGEAKREVYLEGEGYFDVVKHTDKTFMVRTSDIHVHSLGTKFNIKAYPQDDIIETTLVEGKVKVENGNASKVMQKPIYLSPNQTLTFHKTNNSIALNTKKEEREKVSETLNNAIKPSQIDKIVLHEEVNPVLYTSWKDSRWVIDSQRLDDLAIQLERIYDVNIKFKDKDLRNTRFTGTLKDESLEQVLKAMKLTAPIDYEIKGKQVILTKNK